jgi:hypothetical protein
MWSLLPSQHYQFNMNTFLYFTIILLTSTYLKTEYTIPQQCFMHLLNAHLQ